jgi:4-amino-4-deoxy-L-arabinose transferase-like glycosyltransferase
MASTFKNLVGARLYLYLVAACLNISIGSLYVYRLGIGDLDADEFEYLTLAQQLFGSPLEWDGRRALGFPLLLSLLMKFSTEILTIQVAISLLSATATPLFYSLVLRSTGNTFAAATSALTLALWPPALYYANSLYSETLALPFFLLSLLALPESWGKTSSIRWHIAAGLGLGFTIHLRPMYLIFIPFLIAIILFETPRFQQAVKRIATVLVGLTLTILPWSIYASNQLGKPVLVTAAAGETLAGGLNENLFSNLDASSNPGIRQAWIGPGKWLPLYLTGYLTESELKKPYIVQTTLAGERAKDWILDNPLNASYLQLRKLMYMWGIYPLFKGGLIQALFGNFPILALLSLTMVLLVKTPLEKSRNLVRFLSLPLFVTCTALISWGSWRYRIPGDVGLIAFCAIAGTDLWNSKTTAAQQKKPGGANAPTGSG